MLTTRCRSAVSLERQNQQPATGSPLGSSGALVVAAAMNRSLPMRLMSVSWVARSAASTVSNCTKPQPMLPAHPQKA